jgi:hypothetical protein
VNPERAIAAAARTADCRDGNRPPLECATDGIKQLHWA